mmetsp:Transcript_63424/g.115764  ORF Transcript_63424/g.115764 Transcript_63424/m.115764 type:complete len:217 (-) Transcript_63424:47-697(-)
MAVCSSLLVFGLPEGQGESDSTRPTIKLNLDDLGDVVSRQRSLLSTIGLHEERQRLGNTNGVRELHECALAEATLHDGLGHLTANVRSRAVDLCGVFTRECTTTMRTPASVSVNDNLPTSEAGIALWSSDDKFARRVDVQVRVITKQSQGWLAILQSDFFKCLLDNLLHDELVHLLHAGRLHVRACVTSTLRATCCLARLCMLGGNHNSVNFLWLH